MSATASLTILRKPDIFGELFNKEDDSFLNAATSFELSISNAIDDYVQGVPEKMSLLDFSDSHVPIIDF